MLPPRSPFARSLAAAALVLLASVASVLAVRGARQPYAPAAPAYRQKGPNGAAVTVVEFSDFQCPACRFGVASMKDLLALYGKDLRFVFKHYPLTRAHSLAKTAAMAAECAGRQGRFWEFHDLLYDKQAQWAKAEGGARLQDYARDLGLDRAAFADCLKDPAVSALVERDMKEGDEHWVVSTPTFFINGRRFSGVRQLRDRGVIWIDKLLKKR